MSSKIQEKEDEIAEEHRRDETAHRKREILLEGRKPDKKDKRDEWAFQEDALGMSPMSADVEDILYCRT